MAQDNNKTQPNNGGTNEKSASIAEKMTLIVSVLVVFLLIGYLVWHGVFVEKKSLPTISVRAQNTQASRHDNHWTVPIEVHNESELPLESVNVQITAPGLDESIGLTFNYLAENARETAYVIVPQNPTTHPPTAVVESFHAPSRPSGY